MLSSIRRYWLSVPGSKAGPAFIAAGSLSAILLSLEYLLFSPDNLIVDIPISILVTTLGSLIIALALLAGLAATYTRWAIVLDRLGNLGLLLASVGFAVVTITRALRVFNVIVSIIGEMILTGHPAQGIVAFIIGLLGITDQVTGYVSFLPGQVASLAASTGMVLLGIFVIRANANLLPGWATALPLIIGLWRLLQHFFFPNITGAIFPAVIRPDGLPTLNPWSEVLNCLLSLIGSSLWLLLGFAILYRSSEFITTPIGPGDTNAK